MWLVPGRLRLTVLLRSMVLFFAVFFLAAPFARAQDATTGALGGTVTDPAGRAIRAARIILDGAATHTRQEMGSDAQGEFLFGELRPGVYVVEVRADGFLPERVSQADVTLGQALRLDLRLRVAGAAAAVSVTAEAVGQPSLADSPLNATLSPEELRALPIDGRRFQSFALLTPLVNLADGPGDTVAEAASGAGDPAIDAEAGADAGSGLGSDAVRLSVRGLDPSQNSYTEDGLANTRAYDGEPRGGALVPFTIPQEAVREFQVRALGPGGPRGRDAGGAVNAVSRRAEETLHGSVFLQLRNSAAGAADPFAVATRYNNGAPTSSSVKPRDVREQFGGSLGRMVPGTRGRLGLFVAAEAQRRSFPGISSPDNPNFFQLTAIQRALLANRGVSARQISSALSFVDSLGGEVPRHGNELAWFPRLDWQRGARSSASVTYDRVRFDSPAGLRSLTVVPQSRDNFSSLATHTDALTARWLHSLGTRWLNQLQVQASRDGQFVELAPPLPGEPRTARNGAVPQVSIDLANAAAGGSFTFGTPTSAQKRRLPLEKRGEIEEALTFAGRGHTVTLGAGGSLIDTAVETGLASNGAYRFASGATAGRAGGLVDFITDFTYNSSAYPNGGCPSIYAAVHLFCFSSFTESFGTGQAVRYHTAEGAFFAEDAWRLTPRLRVDAGARYEYFRMPLPQHPNATLDAVFGSFAATNDFPGDPGNLAPHLGIAYGLSEHTVVRLGYSIHFGRVTGRALQSVLQNTAQPLTSLNVHILPRTEVEPQCASAGTNFGYPATYTCAPTGAVAHTSAATLLARRFQLPMVQQAELTVEHRVPHGLTLSASYALSLERELPNSIDLNIAPSNARAAFQIQRTDRGGEAGVRDGTVFNVPLYTSRISPFFGPVTAVLSNATGTNHAGVLQLSRVSAEGLTLRFAYTFSKAVDSARSTGSAVNQDAQFDPRDVSYDKARSNFDRPHKLVLSAVWAPRVRSGERLLRGAGDGWSLSPILFATAGQPYSYLIEGGTLLTGGRNSINGSGGATYLPTVGRNTLRLPWTETLDLRLQRALPVRRGIEARLSAEAFNLLNHRNLTGVQQRAFLAGTPVNGVTPLIYQDSAAIAAEGLTSRAFGVPTAANAPLTQQRRVQLGLRLDW